MRKRLFVFAFRFFFYILYRRHLGRILFRAEPLEKLSNTSLPVLLLANHLSWWDGILMIILCERLMPYRDIKIAMLKKEWQKRKWMSHFGALPIDPESPGQLLDFFKGLKVQRTQSSHFCLIYFFEGKMAGPGESLTSPQRGTDLLIEQIAPVIALPLSLVFDIRYRSKPTAFLNLGAPSIISAPQELRLIYAKIESLIQATVSETTKTQEYIETLCSQGWKDLW